MNSSKIYDAVIVVYNHEIKDIPSLALLQKSDYINRIIICDNSTDAGIIRNNVETSESKVKIKYIQMHGNVGLSKAYNRAVSESTSDFIVILDDDTPLPEDFFQLSTDFILSHPSSDIYLPIVQSLHGTLSPCKKNGLHFKSIKDLSQINSEKISAINSGMIIRRSIFSSISYDERLKVDMVDHAFMDSARKNHMKISIMQDIVLSQNYSKDIFDKERQYKRLELSSRDNRVYYSKNIKERLFCEIQILYWKIQLWKKYRFLKNK